jgi:hypothetical protein
MSERAATVIPLPLSVVESNIWDVTGWVAFLGDVEWIERSGHERYVFGIRQGRRVHEVPVGVRWHAREHRVSWRELAGPAWRGEIRLTALNGRRTRVGLEMVVRPRTLIGNLADALGGRGTAVDVDLGRLGERLALIPQPLNPTRLTPTRQLGRQGTLRAARSSDYLAGHAGADLSVPDLDAPDLAVPDLDASDLDEWFPSAERAEARPDALTS